MGTANPTLLKQMGVSERNKVRIERLHAELIDCLNETDEYLRETDRERMRSHFENLEYTLQGLWGFTQDSLYRTWGPRLERRYRQVDYVGKTYKCKTTGVERTITADDDIYMDRFGRNVVIGEGFIDFAGYNVRFVNVESV